jgi:hypothetical protein
MIYIVKGKNQKPVRHTLRWRAYKHISALRSNKIPYEYIPFTNSGVISRTEINKFTMFYLPLAIVKYNNNIIQQSTIETLYALYNGHIDNDNKIDMMITDYFDNYENLNKYSIIERLFFLRGHAEETLMSQNRLSTVMFAGQEHVTNSPEKEIDDKLFIEQIFKNKQEQQEILTDYYLNELEPEQLEQKYNKTYINIRQIVSRIKKDLVKNYK